VTATNKMIMSAKNLQTSEATGWNSQDKMAPRLLSFQTQQQEYRAANCGRKISFIRKEKSPFSRWRKNSKVNTSSRSHRKNQRKDGTNKKKHTHTAMNKSASLTPVQEPSTVVCMIVTSLSQLPSWLYQLPTVGKPVTSINLQTEFLLQFWKQREDSAIRLASNRPQQQGQEKRRPTEKERKTEGKENREILWTSGLTTSSPLTRLKAKSRNFSLKSDPLDLFKRIFKE
jgi:hypothetical protein